MYDVNWFLSKAKEEKYSNVAEEAKKWREKYVNKYNIDGLSKLLKSDDILPRLIKYKDSANSFDSDTRLTEKGKFYYGAADTNSPLSAMMLGVSKSGELKYGKTETLTEEQAKTKSKKIVEALIKIQNLAGGINADDWETYDTFFKEYINYFRGEGKDCSETFVTKGRVKLWVYEYLNILFPKKFTSFYSEKWFLGVEKQFNIQQGENYYKRLFNINKELNNIVNKTGLDKALIYRIICDKLYPEIDAQKDKKSSLENVVENDVKTSQVIIKQNSPLNQILYGPPGTGKTYNSVIKAVEICLGETAVNNKKYDEILKDFNKLKQEGRIAFTTFHQSYGYEEFIQGIKPYTNNGQIEYKVEDGVFKKFCEKAKEKQENFVFIIDEINRGNVSKIFGELITLIEESKRVGNYEAMEITLPYSGKSFGVPNNVYILGTMNTADRSLVQLDAALRRRFRFVEMMPNDKVLNDKTNVDGVNLKELLKAINERITVLIDREHQIGHSYLTKVNNIQDLKEVFENEIIPLLQEYFYEDYEGIKIVLGKKFINDEEKTVGGITKKIYTIEVTDKKDDFIAIYPNQENSTENNIQEESINE